MAMLERAAAQTAAPGSGRVAASEGERAGRWRGMAKTECGIHLGLMGQADGGSV